MVSRQFSRFSHAMDTKRVRMDGSVSPQVQDNAPKKSTNSNVERYKAHLHAIFDGKKPLPDHIRGVHASAALDDVVADCDVTGASDDNTPATTTSAVHCGGVATAGAGTKTLRRIQQAKGVSYDALLARIKQAVSADEVTHATDAFLAAGFTWPQDEDTLSKVLGHRDEKVLAAALTQLKTLFESAEPKNPRLLKSRIDNIALLAHSSDVLALCTSLRAAL